FLQSQKKTNRGGAGPATPYYILIVGCGGTPCRYGYIAFFMLYSLKLNKKNDPQRVVSRIVIV
ncbi:MAG: hypothetical protein V1738_06230, partial [Patescibacteria group bacterium]